MFIASSEAKVGLFSIATIAILLTLFMWLNGAKFMRADSEIEFVFSRVEGLRPGAPAKYLGVDIGRVAQIYFEDDQVIVKLRVNTDVKLPKKIAAVITTASVVGDKHLEIRPTVAEPIRLPKGRLLGETPSSMEDMMNKVTTIMDSLQQITTSLQTLVGDEAIAGSLKSTLQRANHLVTSLDEIVSDSKPQVVSLLENINQASLQLTTTLNTANEFMSEIANNGQTAADIQVILGHIKTIAANLDQFSMLLADNDDQIDLLLDDAHETMESITQATQSIHEAVQQFTTGDVSSTGSTTLTRTGAAVKKATNYLHKLEEIQIQHQLGVGHSQTKIANQTQKDLEVDYSLNIISGSNKALELAFEDIGSANLASLQYGSRLNESLFWTRGGLYKNKFGLGLDYRSPANWRLGIDFWDVDHPNLGFTSNWQFTDKWSILFGGSTNLDDENEVFNLELWHRF